MGHVSGPVMHELALLTTARRIGAGESGKSTVLKQMKLIYATGFSKNERLEWKPVVFNNVVQSMRLIFDVMNDQSIEFENKDNEVWHFPSNNIPFHNSPISQMLKADPVRPP